MAKRRTPPEQKKMSGAPLFEYSQEIAEKICFLISTTDMSLNKVLNYDKSFPKEDTFYNWLFENSNFAEMYRNAKERQQCFLVATQDEHIQWARDYTYTDKEGNERIDPGAIAWAKLKCDNIKWAAARLAPRLYGDKIQITDNSEKNKTKDRVKAQLEKIKKKEREY